MERTFLNRRVGKIVTTDPNKRRKCTDDTLNILINSFTNDYLPCTICRQGKVINVNALLDSGAKHVSYVDEEIGEQLIKLGYKHSSSSSMRVCSTLLVNASCQVIESKPGLG